MHGLTNMCCNSCATTECQRFQRLLTCFGHNFLTFLRSMQYQCYTRALGVRSYVIYANTEHKTSEIQLRIELKREVLFHFNEQWVQIGWISLFDRSVEKCHKTNIPYIQSKQCVCFTKHPQVID